MCNLVSTTVVPCQHKYYLLGVNAWFGASVKVIFRFCQIQSNKQNIPNGKVLVPARKALYQFNIIMDMVFMQYTTHMLMYTILDRANLSVYQFCIFSLNVKILVPANKALYQFSDH